MPQLSSRCTNRSHMKAIGTIESSISEAADNSLESSEPGTERARPRNRGIRLKSIRLLHRYMGLFFSPAILFFAFSGALQTFNLHKPNKTTGYVPATWILELAQLHKDQSIVAPKEKVKTAPADSDTAEKAAPKKAPKNEKS